MLTTYDKDSLDTIFTPQNLDVTNKTIPTHSKSLTDLKVTDHSLKSPTKKLVITLSFNTLKQGFSRKNRELWHAQAKLYEIKTITQPACQSTLKTSAVQLFLLTSSLRQHLTNGEH